MFYLIRHHLFNSRAFYNKFLHSVLRVNWLQNDMNHLLCIVNKKFNFFHFSYFDHFHINKMSRLIKYNVLDILYAKMYTF